jgi:tetratricopeptide (TPR) repeat protein
MESTMANKVRVCGFALIALFVMTGVSCSRDPNVVKRKYLENGNRYFEQGKYKEAYIMYRNALKKDPKYSDAYYRTGLAELRLGRAAAARGDFLRAIDTNPNNVDAKAQLGELDLMAYLAAEQRPRPQNLRKEIEDLAKDLLARNPKSQPALRWRGYLSMLDGDTKGAIQQFSAANQIKPNQPEVVLPLVESLFADKQVEEGERLARMLIASARNFGPIYDALYMQYARTNRSGEAEAILKEKVANNPKQADYALQLARYYFALQRRPEMQAVLATIVSNPKDFPDGRLKVGQFYMAVRDYDSAILEYQEGIRNDPERKIDYQKAMAEALFAQNRRPEAAKVLEEVLKSKPGDEQAQAMRASLLIETGNPQQIQAAVNELQAAVNRMPNNPVWRFHLGRALLANNQIDQARTQFQEASRIQPNYLPARIALAQLFLMRGDNAGALDSAKEILKLDPRNLPAMLVQAAALANMGRNGEARATLDQATKAYPDSRDAAVRLAILDLNEKRYKDAENAFLELQKKYPADPRGIMGLSETYAAQKQYDKGIALLQAELVKQPNHSELRAAIGNLAYRAHQYDLAISQYEELLKANSQAGDVWLRLGDSYRLKGDIQSAIRCFRKTTELRPNDVNGWLQLALVLDATGQREQARPVYQQILKLQPDNAVALNNVAYMMAESGGDLDQALAYAQRARQKAPGNQAIADTLGWIYIKKNLSDDAIRILRNLVTQAPDVSTYRYHLAMALFQKGDKAEARKQLQAALQKRPSQDEAAKIKELMGRIG